jgi:flagella basal body P-ring formation protein FlgA
MGRCERIVGSRCQNISANRRPFGPQFRLSRGHIAPYIGSVDKTLLPLLRLFFFAWLLIAGGSVAHAQGSSATATDAWVAAGQRFALAELKKAGVGRHEVVPGRLDARLRLNACDEVKPYLPQGARLWGKTRVGLRCVKGVTNWNVYLPLTVNVYGPGLVSTAVLPAGHVLGAEDFRQAEVNLAEDLFQPPIADAALLLGRTLARAVTPGQSLRQTTLKPRQWFTAGDKVRIRVVGSDFAVAGAGEAITAGMEGQPARVRTDNGRVVSGRPVADRLLEITL